MNASIKKPLVWSDDLVVFMSITNISRRFDHRVYITKSFTPCHWWKVLSLSAAILHSLIQTDTPLTARSVHWLALHFTATWSILVTLRGNRWRRKQDTAEQPQYTWWSILKKAGHAILGNFSTDQMVIELTKISQKRLKTIDDLKQNTGKSRRDMDGQNWRGLKWIAFKVNLKNFGPPFSQIYISLYQNVIYTAGKSFSVVMWPWFCKWKTFAPPIWRLELIINKNKIT